MFNDDGSEVRIKTEGCKKVKGTIGFDNLGEEVMQAEFSNITIHL